MTDLTSHTPDQERRDFLYIATGTITLTAAAASIWPIFDSMNPSADVLGISSIELDVASLMPGQRITLKWRSQPIFVERRTTKTIAALRKSTPPNLKDPETDDQRALNPEFLVVIGVCTHLGCVPLGQNGTAPRGDWKGWFCPCHGSHYDQSGRIRKGPAPKNLKVPPYEFVNETTIRIG